MSSTNGITHSMTIEQKRWNHQSAVTIPKRLELRPMKGGNEATTGSGITHSVTIEQKRSEPPTGGDNPETVGITNRR